MKVYNHAHEKDCRGKIKVFSLYPELANKDFVVDIKFCRILLQNNKNYPWIILVPRKSNVERLSSLTMEERLQLMREISLCEEVFNELFRPVKTTVSVFEGKNVQLHAYMVAFTDADARWDEHFADNGENGYDDAAKKRIIFEIKRAIMIKMTDNRFCQH